MTNENFSNYRTIISNSIYDRILDRAQLLKGLKVLNINATKVGGGVAELLSSLTKTFNSIGIKYDWKTIIGDDRFFNTTKRFHNALQGTDINFSWQELSHYVFTNCINKISFADYDIVIIHDPQPLTLVDRRDVLNNKWIWRCHIDLSSPNKKLYNFLKPYIDKYDVEIYTSPKFVQNTHHKIKFIEPCISPFTLKNRKVTKEEIDYYIDKYNLPITKPIMLQISRFDMYKDPIGVYRVFKEAKKEVKDLILILCGNHADDDPEGLKIYEKIQKITRNEKDVILITDNDHLLVNVLQRLSSVILQKSKKEGFGLTITEGMYKSKPIITTNVGGIPLQITNNINGFMYNPNDELEMAKQVISICSNHYDYVSLKAQARKSVTNNFLIPNMMLKYLNMFVELLK